MTQIVLVAHTPLAGALKAVAAHAYPDSGPMLLALDVDSGSDPDDTERRLRALVRPLGDAEVLVLVDAFGATPCNVALRLADGVKVRVVAGVNVPMLWRTLCYGHEPLDALVSRAINGAAQGVMHVAAPRPQNQSPAAVPGRDDQVEHPHQQ